MPTILALVIGILIGVVATVIITQIKSVGSLRIYTSDPEDDPYLFLELSKEVSYIYRKKYVLLKVNTDNLIPRK